MEKSSGRTYIIPLTSGLMYVLERLILISSPADSGFTKYFMVLNGLISLNGIVSSMENRPDGFDGKIS
jgi:hypothetical protein